MKTAYDLLMQCPDSQKVRCQIAFNAVSEGRWNDAALTLRNAFREESGSAWRSDVEEFVAYCEKMNGGES